MPYRIDIRTPPDDAFDRLLELGALDIDLAGDGLAAIMPDAIPAERIAAVLGTDIRTTSARGRDDGSVWLLQPRAVRVGRTQMIPADWPPQPGSLRLVDDAAFGTGLHPTTALCLEAMDTELLASCPVTALDVGTGSGILALAALRLGVSRVVAIDIDGEAVRVAAANAQLNDLGSRLTLVRGGPDTLSGTWPLVVANVLTAPLITMAPALSRCVGRSGRIILSGIRSSLARDVEQAYRRVGMRQVREEMREGWSALVVHASW